MTRNPDMIPTKVLQRNERRKQYEAAKAARKRDRLAAKAERAAVKEANRANRDQELWAAVQRGSDLEAKGSDT
jgi:hypothetical protein